MKRRQAGRRIRTRGAKRRAAPVTGRREASRREASLPAGERLRLAQFTVCAAGFVLLVAVKLLLPSQMAEVNQRLTQALERNMDVQSVFRAVGRAFSGEDTAAEAAEEVYRAVFFPGEEETVRASAPAALATEPVSAMETLREYRRDDLKTGEADTPPPQAEPLSGILYSEQNLPESVSLEQAILGFDYTSPLPGAAVSSPFGYREHPTAGEERFHYGVDLAADTGTAIACFADGEVRAVGESSSYGKYCIVDHAGGYATLYAHCSRITVSSGAEVKRGQTVAEVGETGIATGPHLHFELQQGGGYLNPIYYVSVL